MQIFKQNQQDSNRIFKAKLGKNITQTLRKEFEYNPVKLQKLLNHKTIEQTMKYVNLYSTDFADDLDLFNPLDNFKRQNYQPVKRRKVAEV